MTSSIMGPIYPALCRILSERQTHSYITTVTYAYFLNLAGTAEH